MVHGYFRHDANVAYIEVPIFSGHKILRQAFILDTGFSGDLKIDKHTADEFDIVAFEKIWGVNANGERMLVEFAQRYVEMEGRRMLADILIFDGASLAGIGLFAAFGYKVVVDCQNRTAHLERAR